jgi:hypothetical protein
MTRALRWSLVGAALWAGASPRSLAAQGPVTVRAATLYESYRFDAGLIFNKVTEFTVPVGLDLRLGRVGTLSLSTGYANVQLTSADVTQLPHQSINGLLDTEARLSVDVIPGRLILLATGAIPTGTKTVQQEQLAVLGAISSDVIGFSAASLGSGGNVGGGFVGAIPLGRLALGLGATYKKPLSYQPVLGQANLLQPGAELRFRGGLEGGLARRTFLRLAGMFVRSGQDRVAGTARHGVGTRIIGYFSLNQGLGPASVTLYGFDVYRGDPQIEQTATGAAYLPKGNLLAIGGQVDWPVTPRTTISPRVEYRASAAAADTTAAANLQRLGGSLRFGVDLRQAFSPAVGAVLQAGGVTGNVVQAGTDIGFSGLRVALSLEVRP